MPVNYIYRLAVISPSRLQNRQDAQEKAGLMQSNTQSLSPKPGVVLPKPQAK